MIKVIISFYCLINNIVVEINNSGSVLIGEKEIKSHILFTELNSIRDKIGEIHYKGEKRNTALHIIRNNILPKARINADTAIIDILEILNALDYSLSENQLSEDNIYEHFLIKFAKLAKGNYDERFNDSFKTYSEILEILGIKGIDKKILEEMSEI